MNRTYTADTIILDCDSTLTTIEGIDELARRAGVHGELAPLTDAAMAGAMRLEDVYSKRLDLIQPSRADIDWLGNEYVRCLLPGAGRVISVLQSCHKQVHIVSSGIRQAVLVLAGTLGIESGFVHAVDLEFDNSGHYKGYDEDSPLVLSEGKKTVCRSIIGNTHSAVLVGDGITDLEAVQERVAVIGFGGIVNRQAVRNRAADFITTPSLEPLLERVLTREELARAGK